MAGPYLVASKDLVKWLKLEGGVKLPETDDIIEETAWQLMERTSSPATPQLLLMYKDMARKVLKRAGKV